MSENKISLAADEIKAVFKKYDLSGATVMTADGTNVHEVLCLESSFCLASYALASPDHGEITIETSVAAVGGPDKFLSMIKTTATTFVEIGNRYMLLSGIFKNAFEALYEGLLQVRTGVERIQIKRDL